MATHDSGPEVPTWVAGVVVAVVLVAVGYVFFFGGHIAGPLAVLVGLVQFGLALFVVYLLYRFVVAVETIAEKF
jgi:hypothetical protein